LEETGFFISSSMRIDPFDPDTLRMPTDVGESFSLKLEKSPYSKRLYIQAYAMNEAGISLGARKRIKVPEVSLNWWGIADQIEGGWLHSPWFGTFKDYDHNWLYHASMGWVYQSPSADGGVWLWKEDIGWLWTREGIWPYLWSHENGNWIYLPPGSHGPIFFDYANQEYRNF